MYKALNYWVFGGFAGEKTPYEFIDWAKAKGLDGVELTVGDCLSIDITEDECKKIAETTGAILEFIEDPIVATKNADVIYTDVWVSMGEPAEAWKERIDELSPYAVTKEIMANAGENSVFMHCLPAFHDLGTTIGKEVGEKFNREYMEVSDEVFESERSIVFEEAENRMHTIKAVMLATLI